MYLTTNTRQFYIFQRYRKRKTFQDNFHVLFHRNQKARLSKKQCKRNLQKIASCQLPTSPKTSEEIIKAFELQNVMDTYGTTLQNDENADGLSAERFFKYAHSSKDFQYCVFASQNIIDGIKKNIPLRRRKYLIDATFKVCPYGAFNQFLIIHIEHLEEVSRF